MPRIRSIKPQFWLDENLGKILRDARLLYIGLWNLSDDIGVFEWRPVRIKAQIFPYDDDINGDIITKWLELLTNTGDVIQFSNNGNSYGYIPTFLKHQDIKKPSQWRYAEIPEDITRGVLVSHQLSTSTLPVINDSGSSGEPVTIGSREGGVGSREKVLGNKNSDNKLSPDKVKEMKTVITEIKKLRGYDTTKNLAECGAIKRMLLKNYNSKQITETWIKLKAQPYWANQELFMMSVESQIGAIVHGTHIKNNQGTKEPIKHQTGIKIQR